MKVYLSGFFIVLSVATGIAGTQPADIQAVKAKLRQQAGSTAVTSIQLPQPGLFLKRTNGLFYEGSWLPSDKVERTYDSSDSVASEQTFWNTNGEWIQSAHDVYVRQNGHVIRRDMYVDIEGTLTKMGEEVLERTGNLLHSSKTYLLFLGFREQTYEINFSYDDQNRLTGREEQAVEEGTLINVSKTSWTYDSNGRLESTASYDWNGTAWEHEEQLVYSYYPTGLVETMSQYFGDGDQLTNWKPWKRNWYAYHANGLTDSVVSSYWNDSFSGWYESGVGHHEYLQNRLSRIANYSGFGSDAYLTDDLVFEYSPAGDLVSETSRIRDFQTGGMIATGQTLYEYQTPTAVEGEIIRQFSLGQNYPNPFNPETRIPFSLSASGPVTLRILDILGRELNRQDLGFRLAGEHSVPVSAGSLPSGHYLYQIQSGSQKLTRKMTILK